MNLQKQLRHIYAYSFSSCLILTDAVWVVLLTARGFSLWQVGMAEGIFHVVSLLAEIPSGMLADLLGRRRTLMLSGLLAAVSGVVMAFSGSFAGVCLAMGCKAVACNVISGTQEALTYDSLKLHRRQDEYLQIDATVCQLQTLGQALSKLASLLTAALDYVGLYLLDAAVALARTLAACGMTEPIVTEAQAARERQPLRALPARLAAQCRAAFGFLAGHPRVLACIAANATVCLPSYLSLMFVQQRFVELGWPTALLGLPFLLVDLTGIAGSALGRRLPRGPLRPLYAACAVTCGAGTVLVGAAPTWGALFGCVLVEVSISVWMLHAQARLNDAYPSDQRATLVSVDSMAYSLLMIPASPLVGWLGDLTGSSGAGLCSLGVLVALSALAARRRDS